MKKGFTLIELSIVLVIIGLIVAGVTAGQSLIRAAEINAAVQDFKKYETAINAFQLKYDYYPGDMPDAYDYFGSTCGTDQDANASADGCNGNGDNTLNYIACCSANERLNAWRHLAEAELVPRLPKRKPLSASERTEYGEGQQAAAGVNFPVSTMNDDAGFYLGAVGTTRLAGEGNFHQADNPSMLATEAKAIDEKMDDGIPDSGVIIGEKGLFVSGTRCVSGSSYILDEEVMYCRLNYKH